MTSKVEEVARAIAGTTWEMCSERMREQCRHQARQAIRAMHDASPEQIRALNALCEAGNWPERPDVAECYEAMISAALSEGDG
jgi:hypothetical protein